MSEFAAIFIGGPPHAGKSTLLYRLSTALRARDVPHYALRASPDGEGDWSHEAPEAAVRELRSRVRGPWTKPFVDYVRQAIDQRHLPLLVDAGGIPSLESQQIAAACTDAILLAPQAYDFVPWRALLAPLGLSIRAELLSSLDGAQSFAWQGDMLTGTITGLDRHRSTAGICFAALLDQVIATIGLDDNQVYALQMPTANREIVLHLSHALHPLPDHRQAQQWKREELAVLRDALPLGLPLALYGRAPTWVYAAIAAWCTTPPRIFDARWGWVDPPLARCGALPESALLHWQVAPRDDVAIVTITIPAGVLDSVPSTLVVPQCPPALGIILDGKLPNWLFAALARAYQDHPWVAVHAPKLGGAIVIATHDHRQAIGSRVQFLP